jgi:hypothetical protein
MPTFDFTDPSGKSYSVDGPDGATPEQAFQILQQHLGTPAEAPKTPSVGVGEDLAKVATNAPGRVVAGLAGLPGDLLHLGMRSLGDNLSPESSYGSQAIRQSLGSDYEAKTGAGKLAQTAVDFAPAVIGGPETMGAKLLTRVAVPAAASEAAGALTGDNPYAKVAGALAGAGGATAAVRRFNEMAAARQAGNAVPAAEDILKTAKGQFKQAEDMNLTVTPDFASNAAAKMRNDLKGFDPEAQGVVFKAADRLEGLGKPTNTAPYVPVEMNDVELIRKQLTNLKQSTDAPTREAARKAIASLQESQTTLTPAQVLRGDAGEYGQTMRDAIGNYAAGKRSNTLMGKVALGDLNAATAGSGANEDNALRQAIKQLVRPVNNDIVPKAQRLGFSADEIAGLNKVARGTTVGNAARYLGKLAPTGSVSGVLGAGAGYGVGGPVGAIALPAAGYLAKKIGDLSTKRAVSAVDSLVRSRSPLAAQVAAQLPPQIVRQLPAKTQSLLRQPVSQSSGQQAR